jgi:hypothetical protein
MAEINKKVFAELDRKIKFELFSTLPLLLLSVVIPILAWYGIYQYDTDVSIWFQRSGSLTVLFAVWLEFKLFKITNLIKPISKNGLTYQDLAHRAALNTKYGNRLKTYKHITAGLAIAGTVIWGYGDIIRKFF